MNLDAKQGERVVIESQIDASPEQVFAAWTRPDQLLDWWGPTGVSCTSAEVDLRVGGRFALTNRLPDGSEIVIIGIYDRVEPPNLLCYSWISGVEPHRGPSQVTVTFDRSDGGTHIVITHERIATPQISDNHRRGWTGCLEKLDHHLTS